MGYTPTAMYKCIFHLKYFLFHKYLYFDTIACLAISIDRIDIILSYKTIPFYDNQSMMIFLLRI